MSIPIFNIYLSYQINANNGYIFAKLYMNQLLLLNKKWLAQTIV